MACVPPGAKRAASYARPSERQRVLEYEVQRHQSQMHDQNPVPRPKKPTARSWPGRRASQVRFRLAKNSTDIHQTRPMNTSPPGHRRP